MGEAVNRRTWLASLGAFAALPAAGEDPELIARLRREEWLWRKEQEMVEIFDHWGKALSLQMWGGS